MLTFLNFSRIVDTYGFAQPSYLKYKSVDKSKEIYTKKYIQRNI